MNDDTEHAERATSLAEFANAGGQRNQPMGSGHALVRPTSGVAERVIGAQPVAIYRDEQKILQKLASLAAAAGSDWFYRFPVKRKEGGVDYIEGPSIKLANDVARIFGNDAIEVREIDVGDAWTFYARFTDIETGFSLERAYRQRKTQGSLRTRDADRQLDIAYQIGQSKAIRNVITNGLQIYCDYAFEQARNSLVEKIGKDLPRWRERTLEGLAKIPVELNRAERAMGRPAKDWLAPQIAQVVAMMRSIADGMAQADEVFPPIDSSPVDTPAGRGGGESGGVKFATPPSDSAAAVDAAYELGITAKAQGHSVKALPGEYREEGRAIEAAAWRAGYEGQPKPS